MQLGLAAEKRARHLPAAPYYDDNGDDVMKECSKCKLKKPNTEFYGKRSSSDGLNSQCIPCNKETKRKWNEANKEKYLEMKRGHYQRHKEAIRARNKQYYEDNKDQIAEAKKTWAEDNRERNLEEKRNWYLRNKDRHQRLAKTWAKKNSEKKRQDDRRYYELNRGRIKQRTSLWAKSNRDKINALHQRRRNSEPSYAAAIALRSTLKNFLRRAMMQKHSETSEILGYTSESLLQRMECQFVPGQSWENYGTEWHIDHKIPVAHFLAKGESRPHIINALSNLQPLWAFDNLSKGAKILN